MNEEIIESDKDRVLRLETDLLESRAKIVELEAKTKTTLTGSQFLVICLVGPLFLAFVTLGVLIVWKTTSKPAEIILVAFAIFANPVTAAAGVIVGLMSDDIKSRMKDD